MGEEEGISNKKKAILLGAMILSGAANTVVYKAQNSSVVELDGHKYDFNHPFMQAITMFIGEFSVITMFLLTKKATQQKREIYEEEKKHAETLGLSVSYKKYLFLCIPAASDFCTSTLQYIALNFINPSIYQMLRGGVILVTALFSKLFLKKTIHKYMLIGCALVFVGIALVGGSTIAFPQKAAADQSTSGQVVAMLLIIISLLFNGCLFISEEYLFGKFLLHPFQVVGTEGFWGLVIYFSILPILSNVHCPNDKLEGLCVIYKYNPAYSDKDQPESYFESPTLYLRQFGKQAGLAVLVILGVLTIAIFNVCGVNVTKHINALTRSIADVSRTLLVWIACIIVTETAGKSDPEHWAWENVRTGAIIMEIFGFLILVFGNFVYNGIVKLPFAMPPSKTEDESDNNEALIKDISLQQQNDIEDEEDSYIEQQNQVKKSVAKERAKRSIAKDSFHN